MCEIETTNARLAELQRQIAPAISDSAMCEIETAESTNAQLVRAAEPMSMAMTSRAAEPMSMAMTCTALFYRGKHRGERCTVKVFDEERQLCERHSHCKFAKVTPAQCTATLRCRTQCPNIGVYTDNKCPRHNYKKKKQPENMVDPKFLEKLKESESPMVPQELIEKLKI